MKKPLSSQISTDAVDAQLLRTNSSNPYVSEVAPFGITVTVNCPPDTDTPGLLEEAKYKPEETRLISESAGLFEPEVVSRYKFYAQTTELIHL